MDGDGDEKLPSSNLCNLLLLIPVHFIQMNVKTYFPRVIGNGNIIIHSLADV